jgi:hypothetical protein
VADRKDPSQKKKRQRPHLSERWWKKNQDILQYLYEERPIPEIARLVGQSAEQVKTVQEQLEGLRKVRLNSADTMLILKYLPHPRHEYSPGILEEFERLIDKLEEELEDEEGEVITDGSVNHDKYIYG